MHVHHAPLHRTAPIRFGTKSKSELPLKELTDEEKGILASAILNHFGTEPPKQQFEMLKIDEKGHLSAAHLDKPPIEFNLGDFSGTVARSKMGPALPVITVTKESNGNRFRIFINGDGKIGGFEEWFYSTMDYCYKPYSDVRMNQENRKMLNRVILSLKPTEAQPEEPAKA